MIGVLTRAVKKLHQQLIQLPRRIKRVEIVTTANMKIADKNLWHRHTAAGFFYHFIFNFFVSDFDFGEEFFLALQKRFGFHAIRARVFAVD